MGILEIVVEMLKNLSDISVFLFAGRCDTVPSRAGAPWQLWDPSTELEQGQAGWECAHWDRKHVSLQSRTTVTGLKSVRLR